MTPEPSGTEAEPYPGAGPNPQSYLALGVLGVALFFVGIVTPVLSGSPSAGLLRFLFAVVGGVLAAYGFVRYRQLKAQLGGGIPPGTPRRPGELPALPSLEVYSPADRSSEPGARRPRTASLGGVLEWKASLVRSSRRAGALRTVVIGLVLVALLLASLPLPSTAGGTSLAPAAHSPTAPPTTPDTTRPSPSAARPTPFPPSITCTPFYPPPYAPVSGLYPPLPEYSLQSPCKTTHDEVHLTFSSTAPNSGDEVRIPIHLPTSGVPGQAATYGDFYVGMVVAGDPNSVDAQSYAEVAFLPGAPGSSFVWNVSVAVWSLLLNTPCANGLNVTYLNNYGCVQDQTGATNGTRLVSNLAGDTWANLTFRGVAGASNQTLTIYFNDSTTPADSRAFTLSAAATGTYAFHPEFSVACPTRCVLNWSTPFGLGVGGDLCESAYCFSYDAASQAGDPPFEVGSPEYWTGLAYSGDYYYLGPSSSTGACSGAGTVAPCDVAAQAGSYPFYTFNGTLLAFGTNFSWATELFGGAYAEFNALGTMNQYVPLFLDELTNSSAAGYVAPGATFNVSVRLQDLGSVSRVNLSYGLPGLGAFNESMTLSAGAASFGVYNATVPSLGTDGTIAFRVWATNSAGAMVADPAWGLPAATVNRTAIPTITIGIGTVPPTCGGISVGSGPFVGSGSNVSDLAGFYPIRANGCYPYQFLGWATTGGLTVTGASASAELTVHTNGTVTALFGYYRPFDRVTVAGFPTGCGTIALNGSVYPAGSGTDVYLLDAGTYPLSVGACSGDSFGGWTVSNRTNLSVLGPSITLRGNGTLTAGFVPTVSSSRVTFATVPSGCGGVVLRGVGYVTGQSVALVAGTYPVGPDPCAGWGFAGNVTTSGNVSVTAGTLTVSGIGTVTFGYYQLTLVTVVTSPSGCGAVVWDGFAYPNGVVLNVTNHTQHTVSANPCAGDYLVSLSATGGVSLQGTTAVVAGPGTIEAAFRPGTPHDSVSFVTSPATCGTIIFNGVSFTNSQYTAVPPGSVATLAETACTGYGFVMWYHDPGIAIVGGVAYINASGSITAIFHPLVGVFVYTSPSSCGSVEIAGEAFVNNGTAVVPVNAPLPIVAVPCAYMTLSQWVLSVGASVTNGTLTVSGTATVTALFVPAQYAVTVEIAAGGCGQILLDGAPYGNGSTIPLIAAAYPISIDLCPGYGLRAWQTTANLSVSGTTTGTLNVRGTGTVTAVIAAVPPSVTVSTPVTALVGSSVYVVAMVAVPIAPYTYSYAWSFGDGTNASTAANSTTHTYSATGTYTLSVTVTDPLGRRATGETNLTVVPVSGGLSLGLGTTGLMVLGAAGAVVACGAVVAYLRSRREASREPPAESSPALEEPPGFEPPFPPK